MRIYISGPVTGCEDDNRPAFERAEQRITTAGHVAVNPLRHPTGLTWEAYLRLDLADLVTCDAVAVLHGWSHSRGAQLEVHVADSLGMNVQPVRFYAPAAA